MSQLGVNWAISGYSYQNWIIVKIILNVAWGQHIDYWEGGLALPFQLPYMRSVNRLW